jgi:phosphatidylglycerol---prolipoprotein diacylglyceryl transferase
VRFPASPAGDWPYLAALLFGTGIGAFLFGTANLWLAHQSGIARSVEGAILGGIVSVELYKRSAGIATRTGARFALPLAVGVAVGRIGCYFAGLDDFTYGTPTGLPWGVDFGDGVRRHPVQLYEALSMAAMLVVLLWRLKKRDPFWLANGFYIVVGWYGLQRFAWEFIKPYATLAGPINVFHLVCLGLVLYAALMIRSGGRACTTE